MDERVFINYRQLTNILGTDEWHMGLRFTFDGQDYLVIGYWGDDIELEAVDSDE